MGWKVYISVVWRFLFFLGGFWEGILGRDLGGQENRQDGFVFLAVLNG